MATFRVGMHRETNCTYFGYVSLLPDSTKNAKTLEFLPIQSFLFMFKFSMKENYRQIISLKVTSDTYKNYPANTELASTSLSGVPLNIKVPEC